MSTVPPNNLPPTNPASSGDEERIRAALHGYADTIDTADAWPTIVEKLDERRSPFAWFAQHPLALGAAAAVLLLLVIVSVGAITGDGDEESQNLDYVGPDQVVDESTLIAITADGRLVELDASGNQLRQIADLATYGTTIGDTATDLAVPPNGSSAVFTADFQDPLDCQAGMSTAIWEYPLDPAVDPAVTDLGVLVPVGAAASLSSDGFTLAVVVPEDSDPCSEAQALAVAPNFDASSRADYELVQVAIPANVEVTQTLWFDDDRIAVVGHGKDPTISSLSAAALSVWVVDPSTDTELGTPLEVALPLGTRLAPTGMPGEVFVAGHVDSVPFDLNPAGTYIDNANAITIWRGSLDTLDADLVGVVDNSTQLPGGAPSTAAPMPGPEQNVISLSGTPDGDALVTIAEEPATTSTLPPTLYRVIGDVDPAVDPGTRVEQVAVGILAAVPRGTSEPAPSPVSDAGPVVGARADGSMARLDAETGAAVEELASDGDFPLGASIALSLTPSERALVGELAVAADGAIYQTRPIVSDETCDAAFHAKWDIYELSVEGSDVTGFFDDTDPSTGQPSRLPALSPDGKQLAYVTTSSGERCDDALMIGVTDRASGELLATHAMPVGVDITGLTWTEDDALIVQHVAGNDGEFPSIIPVTLHQPLTSGPVSFGASGVAYAAPVVLAPSGDAEWPHLFGASNGGPLHVDLDEIYSDIAHEPPAAITLPWSKDQGSILSVSRDQGDSVWITVGLGEPAWPVSEWESYATYRWALPTTDQASTLAMLSEEFLAVTASPPEAAEPVVETDEPDVIDPSATVPGATVLPTDTVLPGPTTPPVEPATTTPEPPTPPSDDAEMLYLTWQGDLVRRAVGGDHVVLGSLPTNDDPSTGVVHAIAPQMAVTPDGETAFVALQGELSTCPNTTMWKVDLTTGAFEEVGEGQGPAVSPDGTKLAYWRTVENAEAVCDAALVVRDLSSGDETSWIDEAAGHPSVTFENPSISRIEWGPDSRQLAFERLYADGPRGVFMFDTETPSDQPLPEEAFLTAAPPDGGTWTLLGFDGEGVVVRSECGSNCPDDVVVRTFPTDGSVSARADWTMSSLSTDTAYGPRGFLSLRDCVSEGADCYGNPLWYEPLDGLDEVVESQYLVVAATWLP